MSSREDKDTYSNGSAALIATACILIVLYLVAVLFVSTGMNKSFADVLIFTLLGAGYGILTGLIPELGTDQTCCKGFALITFVLALCIFDDLIGSFLMILVNAAIAAIVAIGIQLQLTATAPTQSSAHRHRRYRERRDRRGRGN